MWVKVVGLAGGGVWAEREQTQAGGERGANSGWAAPVLAPLSTAYSNIEMR